MLLIASSQLTAIALEATTTSSRSYETE